MRRRRTEKGRKSFPDHISNSITLIDLPDKDTSIFPPHMCTRRKEPPKNRKRKKSPSSTSPTTLTSFWHLAACVMRDMRDGFMTRKRKMSKEIFPQIAKNERKWESNNKVLAMISTQMELFVAFSLSLSNFIFLINFCKLNQGRIWCLFWLFELCPSAANFSFFEKKKKFRDEKNLETILWDPAQVFQQPAKWPIMLSEALFIPS